MGLNYVVHEEVSPYVWIEDDTFCFHFMSFSSFREKKSTELFPIHHINSMILQSRIYFIPLIMFCPPSQYFLQFYSISFEVMGNGTAVLSDPNRLGKKLLLALQYALFFKQFSKCLLVFLHFISCSLWLFMLSLFGLVSHFCTMSENISFSWAVSLSCSRQICLYDRKPDSRKLCKNKFADIPKRQEKSILVIIVVHKLVSSKMLSLWHDHRC